MIESAFRAGRTALSGATVQMRHDSKVYSGVGGTVQELDQFDLAGNTRPVEGTIRVLVSELGKPWPKTGDTIEIKNTETNTWDSWLVYNTRPDQAKATMWIEYGERY